MRILNLKSWLFSIFVCQALFLLTACGEPPQQNKKPIEKPPLQPQAAPATPPPVTKETRAVYEWYCTQCHGIEGKGNGINALLLTVPPRNHTKKDYLETRTDQQLFDVIQKGGLAVGRAPCMPAWGHTLDEPTMRSLVRYIRELCDCEAL